MCENNLLPCTASVIAFQLKMKAPKNAPIVAYDMGLEWKRSLEPGEVAAIASEAIRSGLTKDIAYDDISAFMDTDLVFEAKDAGGQTNYVVVGVYYAADREAVERAIRDAELIARFTGVPAYAAIVSVEADRGQETY